MNVVGFRDFLRLLELFLEASLQDGIFNLEKTVIKQEPSVPSPGRDFPVVFLLSLLPWTSDTLKLRPGDNRTLSYILLLGAFPHSHSIGSCIWFSAPHLQSPFLPLPPCCLSIMLNLAEQTQPETFRKSKE